MWRLVTLRAPITFSCTSPTCTCTLCRQRTKLTALILHTQIIISWLRQTKIPMFALKVASDKKADKKWPNYVIVRQCQAATPTSRLGKNWSAGQADWSTTAQSDHAFTYLSRACRQWRHCRWFDTADVAQAVHIPRWRRARRQYSHLNRWFIVAASTLQKAVS